MATETQERVDAAPPEGQPPGGTWVIWSVIGLLVLAFVVGGILGKKSKTPSNLSFQGTRAVVLPADVPRTVVVPPCATGAPVTPQNAAAQRSDPGSTVFQLPAGGGVRSVLIPRCTTPSQTASPASNTPSAAFVLPHNILLALGSAKPSAAAIDVGTYRIQSEVTVPNGSPVTTLVAPACPANQLTGRSPTEYVVPPASGGVALAPPC